MSNYILIKKNILINENEILGIETNYENVTIILKNNYKGQKHLIVHKTDLTDDFYKFAKNRGLNITPYEPNDFCQCLGLCSTLFMIFWLIIKLSGF
jgi:hypothetical protein